MLIAFYPARDATMKTYKQLTYELRCQIYALLRSFAGAVFTITADSGKEFAYHEVMTEYLKCGVYFADPYCSWQRGRCFSR